MTVGARLVVWSDIAMVGLSDPEGGRCHVSAFDLHRDAVLDTSTVDSLADSLAAHVLPTGKPWAGAGEEFALTGGALSLTAVKHACALPLVSRDKTFGILAAGRREDIAYTQDDIEFLTLLSSQVAMAVDKSLLSEELRKLKDDLGQERICLEDEIRTELHFEEIVGRSAALQRVLREVEVVAPTGSGVLIKGETGTGKELIARAIHNLSDRRNGPFVKVNCAAIPSGLLESELFGHEKGAFTGAIMRKPGRFEVADKGTLFLDEVGDIPLDLQPKLLRVLQEQEFERLGLAHPAGRCQTGRSHTPGLEKDDRRGRV